ncbi:MAG: hypothetical protein OEV00_12705 [Acidobacteriota bacterium]|nr:hypothetical protein [Acidobacteriota bacterium]MDH3786172.1 hypothetical protein [Acidobacteriota bacterium]
MSETPPVETPPEKPPYVIEGARSGRSKCKTCRRTINKDALRVGVLIEGPFGVGYLWHHLNCLARRQFERVEEAYREEAWQHAKTPPPKLPPLEQLAKLQEEAEEKRKQRKTPPYVELDPSGRARCKHCGEKIEKGSLRVAMGRGIEFGNQIRTAVANVHPACVSEEFDHEESTIEREGFVGTLRANSATMSDEQIEAALREIGDL